MQQIPKVDLNDFLSANPNDKKQFVAQLGSAFEEIGFVALRGHFLSSKLMVDLYTETGTCVNDLLVYEGLAYEYNGGTKKKFQEWVKEYQRGYCKISSNKSIKSNKIGKTSCLLACFRCS